MVGISCGCFHFGERLEFYVKYYCPEVQALWDGEFYINDIPYSLDSWPNGDFDPTWGLPKREEPLLKTLWKDYISWIKKRKRKQMKLEEKREKRKKEKKKEKKKGNKGNR
eukprot:TRINITY_DN3078_c0_g1_i1.p2 TRINITY_DN3078_c0_g1~~TRINITY_DN3078_c0_g1_i1.p2  ORF type:complete len:110 (+),score=27.27 TRINITY_DN3078_c0_g1_i1:546-875(+)